MSVFRTNIAVVSHYEVLENKYKTMNIAKQLTILVQLRL